MNYIKSKFYNLGFYVLQFGNDGICAVALFAVDTFAKIIS